MMENGEDSFHEFLTESGLIKYCKEDEDLNIDLYRDLNVYGDIAESYIELMTEKYGVDVSSFHFENYFPPEFSGDSTSQKYLYSFLPFLASRHNTKKAYEKLTFKTIKQAIENGILK